MVNSYHSVSNWKKLDIPLDQSQDGSNFKCGDAGSRRAKSAGLRWSTGIPAAKGPFQCY